MMSDDTPTVFWLLSFVDGSAERVDRATVDEIESAAVTGQKYVWVQALSGARGLIFIDHVVCVGESTPEAREHDDRIRAALKQEQKDSRIAHGWSELLDDDD